MFRLRTFRSVAVALASSATAVVLAAAGTPAQAAQAAQAGTGAGAGTEATPAISAALSPDAAIAAAAAALSKLGPAGAVAQATPFTLRPAKGGIGTDATIICTAGSDLFISSFGGLNSITARGTTTCPVVMDDLSAQTSLYEWNTFVGSYLRVSIGNLAYGPGTQQTSSVPGWTCPTTAGTYVAFTFHTARRGSAAASTVSQSLPRACQIYP